MRNQGTGDGGLLALETKSRFSCLYVPRIGAARTQWCKNWLNRPLVLLLSLAFVAAGANEGVVSIEGAEEGRISVEFPNEDIRVVLRNVADIYELNLIVPATLEGRTSIKLRNVTWQQVFDVVLSEVNYTYVEEGNIVRIVSRDMLSKDGQSDTIESSEPESVLDVLLMSYKALILGAVAITAVCNICLFIGVLIDSPPDRTRFVPKFVWALFMLLGGVTAAAGYWLIHYSKLRPAGHGSERASTSREPS